MFIIGVEVQGKENRTLRCVTEMGSRRLANRKKKKKTWATVFQWWKQTEIYLPPRTGCQMCQGCDPFQTAVSL